MLAFVNGHLAVATQRGACIYDISTPRAPVLRQTLAGALSDIESDDRHTLFVHTAH